MSEKYTELTAGLSAQLAKLRQEIPETMAGFSALAQAASKEGQLDKKTKELGMAVRRNNRATAQRRRNIKAKK